MTNENKQNVEEEFEFGLYTLGELPPDLQTGRLMSAGQRIQEIIAAAKMADEAGLDVFGIGEHHRLDFAVSSPSVLLAAIAQVTKKIKLTSATTVLSTADPVLTFEDFATLDLISGGRAEIMAGRGVFIESFPLFGYDLDDYEELFTEKMQLLLELNANERITWNGRLRSPLQQAEIAPRPSQEKLPIWIGVGGTPESAVRAGTFGTGMAIAMLGGDPARFKPLADIYKQAGTQAGHAKDDLKIAINSHGYIAKTYEQALDEFYTYYANYFAHCMPRPSGIKMPRSQFEQWAAPHTGLAVGSPQLIIEKILHQHELFGHHRFVAQIDIGGVPLSKIAAAIELLAVEVAPVVRREIKNKRRK